MMNRYNSTVAVDSAVLPGVSFIIERMSFARRVALMRAIREATVKFEFDAAATNVDKMKLSLLSAEVDRLYVQWGLSGVCGLEINGEIATSESLVAAGPEDLFLEALSAVKQECGLSEAEKKT